VSPGEWAGLISAVTGGVTAILGAVGALVLQLRRISPTERHDAAAQASSTDEQQNEQLRKLQDELEQIRREREEDSPS
jgi:uncharacterized protein HemX